MVEQHDSLIGQSVDNIDTPALIVDLHVLEANLRRMADYFASRPCLVRPHFKSHKCVELARRQMAAGSASGITCAKLSEAEQLVAGGIIDILVANQVVGERKAARLAGLNRVATVRCAVDCAANVAQLNQQAGEQGVIVPVLVEVDIGMNRCGTAPGDEAVSLAQVVSQSEHLRFDGLQGYEGHLVNVADAEQRRAQTIDDMKLLIDTRRQIEAAGLPVSIVSGGSSSTYDVTGELEGIDEVQCGSYALMDNTYLSLRPEFGVARTVMATVVSARGGRAVVDVGLKGLGCDFGPPVLADHPDVVAAYTAEEHAPFDGVEAKVGDRLRLIPSHGCTTNSLYREMWIVHDDLIVDRWEIEGAGMLE